jgi:outer membrane receptor protein involved in Fe transport
VNAPASAAVRYARTALALLVLEQLLGARPILEGQSLPTATLTGRVTAEDGAGLPGIRVRLESRSLQGDREISTSATGDFLAALLPPGEYTVTFQAEGMQTVVRTVTLRAASTVRLDQRMQPAAVAESVNVTADAAIASALAAPPIEASYTKSLVDRLPVDRSLRSVVLLAPGVTENGPSGNVGSTNDRKAMMISGALSYSSLFLINGVVANENLRGQPYDLFIEDAIDETTVSTGNISAEYGRFTGGVVNAITRSGGNDFKGSFRVTLNDDRWTANNAFDAAQGLDYRVDHLTETFEETLGGPVWKDHIWLFAAGRQATLSDSRETLLVRRPGDLDPTQTPYVYSTDERRLEGKLTASPAQGHTLVASYIDVRFDERNTTLNMDWLLDTAGLVSREAPYSLFAVNYSGVLTSRLFLEAQYSRRRFSSITGDAIDSDPIQGTVIFDETRGQFASFNSPQGINLEPELYDNDSFSLKGVYFLPTRSAGNHEIHAGYERYSESARRNQHRSGSDFWITHSSGIMRETMIFPSFRPGQTRIEWYPILQPSIGSDLVTDSGFVEDRLQLGSHWSFNLGVRYDRNRDRDSLGTLVSSSGEWSPRLSFRFDPTADGRFEVHGGYARYVDKLHDNIANAASPAGTATFVWLYQGPSCINCNPLAPTNALVPADQALRILFDWFNGMGGTASTPTVSGIVPGVSTRIAPGLKPQSAWEYSAGAGVALGARGFLRADFVYRDYRDLYASRVDLTTGQSPPVYGSAHDMHVVVNSDKLVRCYEAVQAQFSFRLARSLQAAGSYTWSRLTGNSRGEGPAQSALLYAVEEYPEYREESWDFPTGYLSGRGQTQPAADQRHRARFWLVYDLPLGRGDLSAAVLESYDSGLPYEAVGLLDPRPYVKNPGYLEPPSQVPYFFTSPGSFRTDDITRTDMAVTGTIHLFGDVELFVRPEVLNLFNEKGVVAVNSTVLTALNSSALRPFNPFSEKPVRGVNYALGASFGKPTSSADYQIPRTFRLSMGVRF